MPTDMVIDVIRTLVSDPDCEPDGELVERFAISRDPVAFAELVRRHGPTVFGVCRRVLGHVHDAEDAFQAVWLVLARRAADVRPPGAVGPWLYGVAVRTATKARVLAMKRRQRQLAAAKPEAVEDAPLTDLGPVLDEELAKLPERYRRAVVACDLNGRSRSQAARDLGWPEGTVAARVAKGRALLAARLRRRGVTLSAMALAAVAVEVPPSLAANAVTSALEFAAGAASASVSPVSRMLAEGVMRAMSVSRWKLPAMMLMTAGLAAGGAVLAASGGPPDKPPPRSVTVGKPAPEKIMMAWKEKTTLKLTGWMGGSVAFSPDGTILVVGGTEGRVATYKVATWKEHWAFDLDGTFAAVAVAYDGNTIAATIPDGVQLLSKKPLSNGGTNGKEDGWFYEKLTEPGSQPTSVAFFPGKLIVIGGGTEPVATSDKVIFGNARGYFVKTWLEWPKVSTIKTSTVAANAAGGEPANKSAVPIAVAPDGKRVVVIGPIDRDTGKNVLWAWSAGSGVGNELLEGHKAAVTSAAWSADGKTLVTGDADGTAIVWDAKTWKERSRVNLRKMRVSIRRGVGPDGREKLEPGVFDDPSRVVGVAVSADGSRVAATVVHNIHGQDAKHYMECVFVWPAADPPEVSEPIWYPVSSGGPFRGYGSIAFSPDGKSLAAGFCNLNHLTKAGKLIGQVRVWELTPRK